MTVDRASALALAMFPTVGILLLNGLWNEPLYAASPVVFWIADVVTHVGVPFAMLVWLYRRYAVTPAMYGLAARPAGGWTDLVGMSLVTTFVMWVSYRPVAVVVGSWLLAEPATFTYLDAVPEAALEKALVGIYFAASAAVFEEVMYRGLPYLYVGLRCPGALRVPVYVAASSLLFGAAHWENGIHELIATTVLGIAACIVYAKVRILWPLVVGHFLINFAEYVF